jgi:hypothetical protein
MNPVTREEEQDVTFWRDSGNDMVELARDRAQLRSLTGVSACGSVAKAAGWNEKQVMKPVLIEEDLDKLPVESVVKQTQPEQKVVRVPEEQLRRDDTGHVRSKVSSKKSVNKFEHVKSFLQHIHEKDQGGRKAALAHLAEASSHSKFKRCLLHLGLGIDWWEHLEEPERTGFFSDIVHHPVFEVVAMATVVGDQMLSTWSANYSLINLSLDLPPIPTALTFCFNVYFALELVLKLIVHRLFFFCNFHWKMNCLDFFLVTYSVMEVFLLKSEMKLSALRVLRMFKMAKIVRMLKALTAVHDLRIMLDCLLGSFFGLFWALVLISVIMYIFSLIFVQAFTEYMIDEEATLDQGIKAEILTHFGSVSGAVLSVYEMLTGGKEWGEMYDLLEPTGMIAGPACVLMVAFFTISV